MKSEENVFVVSSHLVSEEDTLWEEYTEIFSTRKGAVHLAYWLLTKLRGNFEFQEEKAGQIVWLFLFVQNRPQNC